MTRLIAPLRLTRNLLLSIGRARARKWLLKLPSYLLKSKRRKRRRSPRLSVVLWTMV